MRGGAKLMNHVATKLRNSRDNSALTLTLAAAVDSLSTGRPEARSSKSEARGI